MRVRRVIADQNSVELDQIRRQINNLYRALEGMGASVTAGATAEAIMTALSAGIAAGVDSNPTSATNVVATNVPLEGTKPEPLVPRQVRGALVTSDSTDHY